MTRRRTRPPWHTAVLAAVLAALVLAGCGGGDDSATPGVDSGLVEGEVAPDEQSRTDDGASAQSETGSDTTAAGTASVPLEDRSVIYTVDLVVEVDEVDAAAADAAAVAERFGGYVQSESTSAAPEPLPVEPTFGETVPIYPPTPGQAVLVLRVPAEQHLEAVEALEELGETVSRTRNAQDVTEEVVDVETRIATQEASIDRLQTLLAEATEISDILAIETELTRRIADLESLLARQQQLASMTQMATITVTFAPPETVITEGTGFLAGLEAGWRALVRAVELGVTAVGALLPFVLLLAVLVAPLAVWLVVRHRRRGAGPAEPEPAASDAPPVDDR